MNQDNTKDYTDIKNHDISRFVFPPTPGLSYAPGASAENEEDPPAINLNKLIQPPTSELADLSRDDEGHRIKLNNTQKAQLRTTGKFDVDSQKYPGREHTWRTSFLIQTGTNNIKDRFYNRLASSYEHFALDIPDRLYRSETCNVTKGFKSLFSIVPSTVEMLLGTSHYKESEKNIEPKVIEDLVMSYDKETKTIYFKDGVSGFSTAYYTQLTKKIEGLIKEKKPDSQSDLYDLIEANIPEVEARWIIGVLRTLVNVQQSVSQYNSNRDKAYEDYETSLTQNYPIKSRSARWVSKQMENFKENWTNMRNLDTIITEAINQVGHKVSDIYKNYQANSQLEPIRVPCKMSFEFDIWRPSNYKIVGGETNINHAYLVKYTTVDRTTDYPGYRLTFLVTRIAQYFNNGVGGLWDNLLFGKFGLRSLYGTEDFKTGHKIVQGVVIHQYTTVTWMGRLKRLWSGIKRSRQEFENSPDIGIIGRGITRMFNRLWNYMIYGPISTVVILLGHPFMAALNTIGSIIGLLTSPLWSIVGGILMYLFTVLIWDIDSPNGEMRRFKLFSIILRKLIIGGIGRIVVCSGACVYHVVAGLLGLAWGLFLYALHSGYDGVVYHGILRHKARIPAGDSFAAVRIAGPDLSHDWYHVIDSDMALILIQRTLDQLNMSAYTQHTRRLIDGPKNKLMEFYDSFKPINLRVDESSNKKLQEFENSRRDLNTKLARISEDHWKGYPILCTGSSISSLRMYQDDIDRTKSLGEELCREFVKDNVTYTDDFWNVSGVRKDNYAKLTEFCIKRAASEKILLPLEEDDMRGFELKIIEPNAKKFVKHMFHGEDPLAKQAPRPGDITVPVVLPKPSERRQELLYQMDGLGIVNEEVRDKLMLHNGCLSDFQHKIDQEKKKKEKKE